MRSRVEKIDRIVEALHRYGQRATYGAVSGIVGGIPQGVMTGRPKNHQNSWVVAAARGKRGGFPTGYARDEIDPRLPKSGAPIADAATLLAWLRARVANL